MSNQEVNDFNTYCKHYSELIDNGASQEVLDDTYTTLFNMFNQVTKSIADKMPKTWTPHFYQLEISKRTEKINKIKSDHRDNLKKYHERVSKEDHVFRKKLAANKKLKWEAAKTGKTYKGKFVKKKNIKKPEDLVLPTELSRGIPITKCFRRNYMRRARRRLGMNKMPEKFFYPVLTKNQKRNIKKKAARKRAFQRKLKEEDASF